MEKPHRGLEVCRRSVDLVTEVYRLTEAFPEREEYTLSSQMRRSVVSIPSNIAEGAARNTRKEFVNFLHMAQASLSELDTQLEIAHRLAYLEDLARSKSENTMQQVDKMLCGLIKSLKERGVKSKQSGMKGEW